MRVIQLNDNYDQTLQDVADRHGVDKEKLWEAYLAMSRSNYYQDLCDIAEENIEELKQHDNYKNPCELTIYKGKDGNYTLRYENGDEYYCSKEELLTELDEHMENMVV